jgi:hypothetical protein
MAKFYTELNDTLRTFITEQKMFFVATAPTRGRINLSPKGLDTLRTLDDRTVAYLDVTGSGNETAAHLLEDGRMTMMFCSFSGSPLIVRLHGRGRVVHQRDEEWPALYALFEELPGARQIMVMDIDSVQSSCGQGVPVYDFKRERDILPREAEARGPDGIEAYQKEYNLVSIDGLPTNLMSD